MRKSLTFSILTPPGMSWTGMRKAEVIVLVRETQEKASFQADGPTKKFSEKFQTSRLILLLIDCLVGMAQRLL